MLRQENVGVTEDESVAIILLTIKKPLFNEVDLMSTECAACGVEEDEVVANGVSELVGSAHDIEFIERGVEDVAPQSPPVVCEVVVISEHVPYFLSNRAIKDL